MAFGAVGALAYPILGIALKHAIVDVLAYVVFVTSTMLGVGLRRLSPKTQLPTIVFAVATLPIVPLTLLDVFAIALVVSEKGRRVLSEGYQAVVDVTTHVEPTTSTPHALLMSTLVFILVFALRILWFIVTAHG